MSTSNLAELIAEAMKTGSADQLCADLGLPAPQPKQESTIFGAINRQQQATPRRLTDFRMGLACITNPSR
jgi:hypothetical protein